MNNKVLPVCMSALTAIIGMGLGGAFYFWIFSQIPGFGLLRVFIVLIFLAGITLMSFVVYTRINELKNEDEADLKKY